MASEVPTLLAIALALAISMQGTLGKIECENLDKDSCAYAISSLGKRCLLEKKTLFRSGNEIYMCRTSEIVADKMNDWVETDECINACGLDRTTLGISSDFLLEKDFTQTICSKGCYDKCPNIVDLHFNLAAGEGVFLPKLCRANGRREMAEIKSSGYVAPGPDAGDNVMAADFAYAPWPSMAPF